MDESREASPANSDGVDDSAWQAAQVVEVRPALSLAELQQAYSLVHRKYVERGYSAPESAGIRVSKYNILPESLSVVGVLRGEVVATVTLVPDSPLGLPMESIYAREIAGLRAAGRRPAEVSMLADRRSFGARALPMLLRMMKVLFDYARNVLKCTDLCITVHPHHERFYARYLLFEQMGEVRDYPFVQDNPAVAERLNLEGIEQRCQQHPRLLKVFFGSTTPPELFANRYTFTGDDIRLLFVESVPVLPSLGCQEVGYLQSQYPECDFQEMIRTAS